MLEMAPRDHVANIPLQKFGCGGLLGSGSVRSGQVGWSDAFMGSGIYAFPPSPSLRAKHNIYLFFLFLLYSPTERHETAVAAAAAKSKGARAAAAVVSPKNSRGSAQIPDSNLEHKNRRP